MASRKSRRIRLSCTPGSVGVALGCSPKGSPILSSSYPKRSLFSRILRKRAQKLEAKGKPVDFKELLRMEPDGGITNIRNTSSAQWKRWLALDQRPFAGLAQSPNTWCNCT